RPLKGKPWCRRNQRSNGRSRPLVNEGSAQSPREAASPRPGPRCRVLLHGCSLLRCWAGSGRGRKLSGDQITLPTTVDYSSVPKQAEVEDWTSWDEDAPTSVKIEGGNGNVANQQNGLEELEPDYFKDMAPTIRKTQKIIVKKREPLNFGNQDGTTGFSSRLAATQDVPFIHQSPELGDLETWQENRNAWEEEEDASWQAEEVLR
uniref:Estrogen receptor binding site associated antigen 9 n=1 Tax=Salvator merianae TaxID=96440 RepID=A0A8D0E8R1_SALMN